jgi:hypothetical protein
MDKKIARRLGFKRGLQVYHVYYLNYQNDSVHYTVLAYSILQALKKFRIEIKANCEHLNIPYSSSLVRVYKVEVDPNSTLIQ